MAQVDLHEHDAYYNHYRTKSLQDHSDDPLRSRMPITEAGEEEDLLLRDRFISQLQTRLYHAEGGRRPQTHAPPQSAHGGGAAGTAVGSTLAQAWRGRYEECPHVASALAEVLTGDRGVWDLACGSGYYTGELRRRGLAVVGLDAEGSVAQLLGGASVRELDAWEAFGDSCQPGPPGHVVCLALEEPRWPDRLPNLLRNAARCADGAVVLNWPAAAARGPLYEALFVDGGLALNASATTLVQTAADAGRSVTRAYARHGVAVSQCAGSAPFAVFADATQLLRLHQAQTEAPAFRPTIAWPRDGAMLSVTRRVEAEGLPLVLGFSDYPPAPASACAAIFVDGEPAGRTCRPESTFKIPARRSESRLHVITALGVVIDASGRLVVGGQVSVSIWLEHVSGAGPAGGDVTHRCNVKPAGGGGVGTDWTGGCVGWPFDKARAGGSVAGAALGGEAAPCVAARVCAVVDYLPRCAQARQGGVLAAADGQAGSGDRGCRGQMIALRVAAWGLQTTAYTLCASGAGGAPWAYRFLATGLTAGAHALELLLPASGGGGEGSALRFALLRGDAPGDATCGGNVSLRVTEPGEAGPVARGGSEWNEAGPGLESLFCAVPARRIETLLPPLLWARGGAGPGMLRSEAGGYRLEQLAVDGETVSFRVINAAQAPGTVDWVYVRAVGPGVAVGRVRHLGDGDYDATLRLPAAGVYVVQVVRAWAELPQRVVGRRGLETVADDATLGQAGTQADLVAALQSADSVAGHVHISANSPAFAQRPPCGTSGGLRPGLWLRSAREGWGTDDGAERGSGAGVDVCPLVQGGWQWQPYECRQVHRCSAWARGSGTRGDAAYPRWLTLVTASRRLATGPRE